MLKDATLSPDEKAAATRGLMFLIGHHAIIGGAMGLPLMATAAATMSFMASLLKSNEPEDLQTRLRRIFGTDTIGDILLHGVPAGLFDANVSANLGMGQTFSLVPFSDVTPDRSGLEQLALGMLGPSFGLAAQMVSAAERGTKGDYYSMLAGMLPGAARSSLQAAFEQTIGTTNRRGDLLLSPEEVTMWDSTLKALGFTTQQTYIRNMVRQNNVAFERFFNARTTDLKRKYANAHAEMDRDTMLELMAEWSELQDFRRRYGFTVQPVSNLRTALAERRERERRTVAGVQVNKPSHRIPAETLTGQMATWRPPSME
jgi:hypothetical protein